MTEVSVEPCFKKCRVVSENNINIVWRHIERGLQIIHHCTLQFQKVYLYQGD